MALEHPRLLAASLTAALVSTACSTPGDNPTPPDAPNDTARSQTMVGSGADATSQDQGQEPQGQGPATIDQQRRAALVAHYLEIGERLRADGKLDAALSELLKAKELSPENQQVLNMIAAVQAERGVPVGGAIDFHTEQVRLAEIAEQRGRALVEDSLQKAHEKATAMDFKGAADELSNAKIVIASRTQDWGDLPAKVDSALADAEQRLAEQQRGEKARFNDELAKKLTEERNQREARRRAKMDLLLKEAQRAFQARQFRHAQDVALKALEVDSANPIAQDMVHAATKAARDQAADDYYNQKAKEIRAMIESREELKIPQTEVLRMDEATWERARLRRSTSSLPIEADPQDQALMHLVETVPVGKVKFTADSGDYNEVIAHLNRVTNVPIIVTPQGREVISSEGLKMEIELVESLSLKNFLDLMVQKAANLAWTVRNGVVLIGNKSEASGTIVSQVRDVKDLVFKRAQFTPPRIRDIPGSDGGNDDTPRSGGESDEKFTLIEIGDLVTNIKDATDPTYWDSEGVAFTSEETGYLIIKASAEMQARVDRVLADIRRFSTPVVTIDSKFLTVTRNFLQDVGVDFRGLGGAGNKGVTASLDDLTNGLQSNSSRGLDNGGTGDPAANPLAGAFFNDGGDGDVRGRTENFFTSGLGRALTANGGMTASWTYIGDTQFNAIMHAVEKNEEAEIVNSQILSVLDRERGHVAIMNQTAYVRDFDVEVAQASFIADPKVDVIQDGIVLDVTPVIQQDRKYIILNLNPTIAELQRPIPTFTTSLAGSTLPVTLQLPNLTVTSVSTTARVPDGGTVLLGGLRQILTRERRAEVPLLAQLPLISFFFKDEGQADENRNLMVMVRAWITDVRDMEGK